MTRQIARLRVTALTLMISLGALCATSAQAAGTSPLDHLYYGVKAGFMIPDIGIMGNAINVGGFVGAPITRVAQGTFSGEVEATTSVIKGDINYLGVSGHWGVTTLAGYGVFRTNGPIYFKAKAGYLFENGTFSIAGSPYTYGGSDSGASFGVGGGMHLGGGHSIELEYTIIDSDINFLSVGYKF